MLFFCASSGCSVYVFQYWLLFIILRRPILFPLIKSLIFSSYAYFPYAISIFPHAISIFPTLTLFFSRLITWHSIRGSVTEPRQLNYQLLGPAKFDIYYKLRFSLVNSINTYKFVLQEGIFGLIWALSMCFFLHRIINFSFAKCF